MSKPMLVEGRSIRLSAEHLKEAGFEVPDNIEECEITINRVKTKARVDVMDHPLYHHLTGPGGWAKDIAYAAVKAFITYNGHAPEAAVAAFDEDMHIVTLMYEIQEWKDNQ